MKVSFIEKSQNKAGTMYGLALLKSGKFGVYVLKENYAGHVRGGIAKSWAYCAKELTEKDARDLFNKKINGKARA